MNQTSFNHFEALWALGYHNLIPIVPPGADLSERSSLYARLQGGEDARGKAPGLKRDDGKWRGLDFPDYVADEYDLRRWRGWGAGVGIVCRDDVKAIDADTLNVDLARLIKREIDAAIGPCPIRIGKFPKALYVMRVSAPFPYQMFEFGPAQKKRERIEILSTGKQFVAHGVHPGTMEPYQWPVELAPHDELPIVAPEVLTDLMARLKALLPDAGPLQGTGGDIEVDQTKLPGDPETIAAAVRATPNTHERFPTRESYRDYGYAIKASLPNDPDLAFSLFSEWCEGWRGPDGAENEPEIVAGDWRRMRGPPFRVGKNRIYRLAREANGFDGWRAELTKKFHENVIDEPESIFPPDEVVDPADKLMGTYYDFPSGCDIEPRCFLYGGHYLREYVSATIAPTKVGKSSLGIVEALAMASGKPLLGIQPEGVFRVRIWNGEDPKREMDRRIAAAMQLYGLMREDIGDRLIINSGRDQPIAMAAQTSKGVTVYQPIVDGLIRTLERQKVDALIIDPFIKVHSVSENDNMAIDAVVREWNRVAGAANIALELVHHSRKLNGGEASIDDARGASALVSAARAARVLARMGKKEGEKLGLLKKYKRLFRFADAASNMVAPSDADDLWMEIQSVDLRNARFDEAGKIMRKSDLVGVVKLFDLGGVPKESDSVEQEREAACLAQMASGEWRRDHRAGDTWAGVLIARVFALDMDDPEHKARAKAMLTRWLKEQKITEVTRKDKHRNPHSYLELVQKTPSADLFG